MLFHEQKIEHHILHVLSRQPEHGYRIAQAIKSRAQGLIDGQESMLYPVLYSQEHQGIIESYLQTYVIRDSGRS